jgi:MSHA biogenesis protein MshN
VLEHELGASERAAQLLQDGLALTPGDAAQALLLARIQVAQGDAHAALATLELNAVTGAEAEGLRGGILAQQGRFQAALPAYESAARQQPANPMWWFGLGVALDAEGQGGKARLAFARAQQLGLQRDDLQQFVDQRLRTPE